MRGRRAAGGGRRGIRRRILHDMSTMITGESLILAAIARLTRGCDIGRPHALVMTNRPPPPPVDGSDTAATDREGR